VQQTANSIRSIINHFQDITEIDKTDNHYGDINILLDEISEEEIKNIIKKKKNTSPGPDKIPYIALQRSPPIVLTILTAILNTSIKTGYIPLPWKRAYTIFIPKPNKSRFSTASYRPITLTNTIAKICETVLSKRINFYMEDSNLLTKNQAGFRSGVSTVDQLMRIVTDMQIAINKGWRGAAVFMDLSSAFDTVWHDGLLYKLYAMNFPTTIIRWITNFLT